MQIFSKRVMIIATVQPEAAWSVPWHGWQENTTFHINSIRHITQLNRTFHFRATSITFKLPLQSANAYSCSYCYHHHQSDDVIQDMHAHILPHSVTEQIKWNKGNDNTSCIALRMSDKLLLQLIIVTKEVFWMEETRRDKSLRGSQLQIRHLTTTEFRPAVPSRCKWDTQW